MQLQNRGIHFSFYKLTDLKHLLGLLFLFLGLLHLKKKVIFGLRPEPEQGSGYYKHNIGVGMMCNSVMHLR